VLLSEPQNKNVIPFLITQYQLSTREVLILIVVPCIFIWVY